jgi:hypothetical protein
MPISALSLTYLSINSDRPQSPLGAFRGDLPKVTTDIQQRLAFCGDVLADQGPSFIQGVSPSLLKKAGTYRTAEDSVRLALKGSDDCHSPSVPIQLSGSLHQIGHVLLSFLRVNCLRSHH